ncbi:MAG: M48 family metallopeptidase [Proteobacteria bacterium]|nr:M48 family metallopeptidase [Pseudomonadota bacterium]
MLQLPCKRHPRARRIKLSVDERGPRLTLPMRASLRTAEHFAQDHVAWLEVQIANLAFDAPEPLRAGITSALPLRGEWLPVRWIAGRVNRVTLVDNELLFEQRGNSGSAVRRALRDFYEAQARADLAAWLPNYVGALPRQPSRIVLRKMSSQWGSLAPSGAISLDLSLVLARPSAFEYVLVHELCHLIRADHSPAFWREVQARCPHWRRERTYFHAEGRALKARLRAVT